VLAVLVLVAYFWMARKPVMAGTEHVFELVSTPSEAPAEAATGSPTRRPPRQVQKCEVPALTKNDTAAAYVQPTPQTPTPPTRHRRTSGTHATAADDDSAVGHEHRRI